MIFYEDGSTYSDAEGSVEGAPGRGVLIVAQSDADCGRELVHRRDWYWWRDDLARWVGGDVHGLADYLGQPGWCKAIQGVSTSHERYQRAYVRANADPYLPPKSARLPHEDPAP